MSAAAPKTPAKSGPPRAGRWLLYVACLLAPAFSACGTASYSFDDAGGGGPSDTPPEDGIEIQFEGGAVLEIAPRATKTVAVRISPPRAYTVRFALLNQGDAGAYDAALDQDEVTSDTNGHADVKLIGPSQATTGLVLRAQVESAAATIPISVLISNQKTLEVQASYSGKRTVTEWIVSLQPETSCADLPAGIPPDGTPLTRVAPGEIALIEDVEITEKLAVTVRAGQFAKGCADVDGSLPDEKLTVVVPVTDRPLRLSDTVLDVAFGLDSQDAAFSAALDSGLDQVVGAFRGDSPNDVEALLDTMQSEVSFAEQAEFASARSRNDWANLLERTVFQGNDSRLSAAITRWGRIGRTALLSPRAFEGRLGSGAMDSDLGRLDIELVGEVAANLLDFAVEMSSWDADASDTLVFGGEFSWVQSELVAGLTQSPAMAETGASDVPAALSIVAGCAQVGGGLATSDAAFAATCGAACLETACRSALAALWQRATSASGETRTRLSVAATGKASVGELAQATAIDGSWVGRLLTEESESGSGGALVGFAPKYAVR